MSEQPSLVDVANTASADSVDPCGSDQDIVEHDDANIQIQFTAKLRDTAAKTFEHVNIGGMPRTTRSMKRVPGPHDRWMSAFPAD